MPRRQPRGAGASLAAEQASHHRLVGEGVAEGEDVGRFFGEEPGVRPTAAGSR